MKLFDYEKKIYSRRQKGHIRLLKGGVVGLLPKEIKELTAKSKVCDLGCGAGYYTGEILKKNCPRLKVYAVDISKNAISQAKANYKGINFRRASAYKLPFTNAFFDGVIVNCTLEHLGKPQNALNEVRRVLKPDGLLFSVTPIEGAKFVFFQDATLSRKYHGHLQRFDQKTLLKLLESSGFDIKRYYFSGFIFCQLISGVYLRLLKMLNRPQEYQPSDSKLKPIKYLLNFLINLESFLIPNKIPGLYMHVISSKSK
ncbi:hypothetical protein A2715_02585 [Candidatus Woesebacteria bacterium RIFCSPHIGHO2_01_FULL_39_32]|uniref:Methyltransferase type 11 domain-containing protein n=2 Tax=Candidatus Woeseibacteriota TaxID=1752722 RepID=A0A1F8BK19_9BACT|nr:MAG: hypothetical protein A2124_01380 [Candidatus Woesebacteria bacterium GWB1_37_5]OGM24040.1 MAG: hypothetical protein A2715_02585 [Candidatus Woesebacteria bacterium RIFCSPHIGHO2_01_FULL_39_32]OGM38039.1 MAG: hypothetical protein A3F01_05895 [Candidatus Woesebacteria bacterium RIFCSPHIGHO2_12_FULL_38_11]OGM64383.1 MAG: hypothetical protein A2893_00760 [Candidatus Woesebacteria bacterium RIFCSPLOWO2_01_FULL_39_25]